MNEEQLPIEQSNVVTGETKIKRSFNFWYFLVALVINLFLTILYCVLPFFRPRGEAISVMDLFNLVTSILILFIVLSFIILISFILLYLFRSQYKNIFLSLITSIITFIFFLIFSNLDDFNIIWMGILSAIFTTIIYFIKESKKKTITKKIVYQFYLSLLISVIVLLLLSTNVAIDMNSNAKYRNKIDLQRIVPADVMSDYSNVNYKVEYLEIKKSNNNHRVYITQIMNNFKSETKDNYISGIIDVTLSKKNYDRLDPRTIIINNQNATLSCQNSRSCDIYWKTGKYYINFYASIDGDSVYGDAVDENKVQNELTSIMMDVAKKIEQNSQYLNDSK